jgi:hypothetical protein
VHLLYVNSRVCYMLCKMSHPTSAVTTVRVYTGRNDDTGIILHISLMQNLLQQQIGIMISFHLSIESVSSSGAVFMFLLSLFLTF